MLGLGRLGLTGAIAGAGALTGGLAGSNFATVEDQEYGTMAAAGAITGAALGAAAGLSGPEILEKNGGGVIGLGKKAPDFLEAVGDKVINTGKTVFPHAKTAAKAAGSSLGKFAETMVKENSGAMFGYSLSGKGKLLLMGAAAVSGILEAGNTYDQIRMGTPAGIVNSTPRPEPLDNFQKDMAETYGAGGDLVFALNRNRRG